MLVTQDKTLAGNEHIKSHLGVSLFWCHRESSILHPRLSGWAIWMWALAATPFFGYAKLCLIMAIEAVAFLQCIK